MSKVVQTVMEDLAQQANALVRRDEASEVSLTMRFHGTADQLPTIQRQLDLATQCARWTFCTITVMEDPESTPEEPHHFMLVAGLAINVSMFLHAMIWATENAR